MANSISYSIQPVDFTDVANIIRIGKESFVSDRNTKVKNLGNATVAYLQDETANYRLIRDIEKRKQVFVKAVDDETGDILGSSSFLFHGFELDEIPKSDPGKKPDIEVLKALEGEKVKVEDMTEADKAIAKLEEMQNKDMEHWQEILMPPGSKCIIVTGVSVDIRYQRKGIGGALLKWGTDQADKKGVFMWVHSSETGWRAYAKAGFEVVGTLDVDLDEWAPAPPPEDEGDLWGHYVIRYMKRLPREHLKS